MLQSQLKVRVRKSLSADGISAPAQLIASCFAARTQAHIAHLQTTSYAQHKALDEFYNEIIELADAYAESYQGRFGIIAEYPNVTFESKDGLTVVTELRSIIDAIRGDCGSQSELQNAIDEIVSLCNSTIYKLTNLK